MVLHTTGNAETKKKGTCIQLSAVSFYSLDTNAVTVYNLSTGSKAFYDSARQMLHKGVMNIYSHSLRKKQDNQVNWVFGDTTNFAPHIPRSMVKPSESSYLH